MRDETRKELDELMDTYKQKRESAVHEQQGG